MQLKNLISDSFYVFIPFFFFVTVLNFSWFNLLEYGFDAKIYLGGAGTTQYIHYRTILLYCFIGIYALCSYYIAKVDSKIVFFLTMSIIVFYTGIFEFPFSIYSFIYSIRNGLGLYWIKNTVFKFFYLSFYIPLGYFFKGKKLLERKHWLTYLLAASFIFILYFYKSIPALILGQPDIIPDGSVTLNLDIMIAKILVYGMKLVFFVMSIHIIHRSLKFKDVLH